MTTVLVVDDDAAVREISACMLEELGYVVLQAESGPDALARIEDAGLRTRGGRREWVAVYDWRVLEKLTELETSGRDRDRDRGAYDYDYDPWRQFYVGLA